ncbi:M23 family metallopeptidase [Spirochaetota bacterium]
MVKCICSIWFILCIVSGPLFPLSVYFSRKKFAPGSLVYIKVKTASGEKLSKITENKKKLPFYRMNTTNEFHAFAGYDVQYFPKSVTFRFYTSKKVYKKTYVMHVGKAEKRHVGIVKQKNIEILSKKSVMAAENKYFHDFYKVLTKQYWEGNWKYPVKKIRITSPYGVLRNYVNKKRSYHRGVDFGGVKGTPVYAPNNGVVVYVGKKYVRGKLIVINHGMGIYTSYFHLFKTHVRRGQRVYKGQKIAQIGDSGLATGAHLHWDVRINNTCINGFYLINNNFYIKFR